MPWDVPGPRARVVRAEALDARRERESLLAAAREQADALLREAEAQRDGVREEARAAGRAEGLAAAQEAIVEIQLQRTRLLDAEVTTAAIVEVAMAVARRILGESWSICPERWASACAEALGPLRRTRGLTLRVAPGAAVALRPALEALLDAAGAVLDVRLEEDASIEEPGCIAHSEAGRVDGRLSTQLAALRRVLLEDADARR
jgi:type III secretion protein L